MMAKREFIYPLCYNIQRKRYLLRYLPSFQSKQKENLYSPIMLNGNLPSPQNLPISGECSSRPSQTASQSQGQCSLPEPIGRMGQVMTFSHLQRKKEKEKVRIKSQNKIRSCQEVSRRNKYVRIYPLMWAFCRHIKYAFNIGKETAPVMRSTVQAIARKWLLWVQYGLSVLKG